MRAYGRFYEERRQRRSVALKLMQKYGVDTTDWNRVNAFCRDPRITGKVFATLSIEELERLAVKLRIMLRKRDDGCCSKSEKKENTIYILNLDAL